MKSLTESILDSQDDVMDSADKVAEAYLLLSKVRKEIQATLVSYLKKNRIKYGVSEEEDAYEDDGTPFQYHQYGFFEGMPEKYPEFSSYFSNVVQNAINRANVQAKRRKLDIVFSTDPGAKWDTEPAAFAVLNDGETNRPIVDCWKPTSSGEKYIVTIYEEI